MIPALQIIVLMTAPAALAAARRLRPRLPPEEDAELDRAWAAAHVND